MFKICILFLVTILYSRAEKSLLINYFNELDNIKFSGHSKTVITKDHAKWKSAISLHNQHVTSAKEENYEDITLFDVDFEMSSAGDIYRVSCSYPNTKTAAYNATHGYNGKIYYSHSFAEDRAIINDKMISRIENNYLEILKYSQGAHLFSIGKGLALSDLLAKDGDYFLVKESSEGKDYLLMSYSILIYSNVGGYDLYCDYTNKFEVIGEEVKPISYICSKRLEDGYQPLSYKSYEVSFSSYEKVSDTYLPKSVNVDIYQYISRVSDANLNPYQIRYKKPRTQFTVHNTSINLDEIVPIDTLPITNDIFKEGTKVQDNITGENYIVGEINVK